MGRRFPIVLEFLDCQACPSDLCSSSPKSSMAIHQTTDSNGEITKEKSVVHNIIIHNINHDFLKFIVITNAYQTLSQYPLLINELLHHQY